jgi:hypothetical protein
MEMSEQLCALADLHSGKRAHGIHRIGGCVGPKAGLDTVEILEVQTVLNYDAANRG